MCRDVEWKSTLDETLPGTCSLLRRWQRAERAVRHSVLDGRDVCQAAMRSHGEVTRVWSARSVHCPQPGCAERQKQQLQLLERQQSRPLSGKEPDMSSHDRRPVYAEGRNSKHPRLVLVVSSEGCSSYAAPRPVSIDRERCGRQACRTVHRSDHRAHSAARGGARGCVLAERCSRCVWSNWCIALCLCSCCRTRAQASEMQRAALHTMSTAAGRHSWRADVRCWLSGLASLRTDAKGEQRPVCVC